MIGPFKSCHLVLSVDPTDTFLFLFTPNETASMLLLGALALGSTVAAMFFVGHRSCQVL